MSASVETIHHARCYECGWEEMHTWSDDARGAADAHNVTHQSSEPESNR